jgi:nucleoside-diphosphate-sugar epimerase
VTTLLIFGFGYCGRAVANAAADCNVVATTRSLDPAFVAGPDPVLSGGVAPRQIVPREPTMPRHIAAVAAQSVAAKLVAFAAAEAAIAVATHILVTAPPDASGDPVLNRYADAISAAPALRWIGYLSSTVVYGDRNGDWVDEDTAPSPSQARGRRRLDAELAWSRFASRCTVDLFRLAGVYGPGRSVFDGLRAGTARRMSKPGHQFGRIHRDDIARAVTAAMHQARSPGVRVLNLVDDVPAESAAVVTEAARLIGVVPPPEITFVDAVPAMSQMARSFWAENRKVSGRQTQRVLGLRWLYPSFREGLAAILHEESGQRSP